MQAFSNLTPITKSRINPQQNKNQPPLAESSTSNPHHTRLCHPTRCRSDGKLSSPWGNTRKSLLIPLINTENKKIKTSATAGTKRRTHLLGIKGNTVTPVTNRWAVI